MLKLIRNIIIFMIIMSFVLTSLMACGKNDNNEDGSDLSGTAYDVNNFVNGEDIVLKNSKISFAIDKEKGYIKKVENLQNNSIVFDEEKNTDSNFGFPFSIMLGKYKYEAKINSKTKNRIQQISSVKNDNDYTIRFDFGELVDDVTGEKSGTFVKVDYFFSSDSDYVTYKVHLKNDEKGLVSKLVFCDNVDFKISDDQKLAIPLWGGGTYWTNLKENKDFVNGVTTAYPGKRNDGSYTIQEMGYAEIYNDKKGLGVGYINSDLLAMEFSYKAVGDKIRISPTLFALTQIVNEHVQLIKNESYSTGSLIIAPHSGDWHRMADIYRKEYQKSFVKDDGSPDYLTKDNISPVLREIDYIMRYIAVDNGKINYTFEEIKENYKQNILKYHNGKNPNLNNFMIHITGANTNGFAYDVPYVTPMGEKIGGNTKFVELVDSIHKDGGVVTIKNINLIVRESNNN